MERSQRRRLREIGDWEPAFSRPLLIVGGLVAALPTLAFRLDAALLPAAVAVAAQLLFPGATLRQHRWLAQLERRSRARWSATRARRHRDPVRTALDVTMNWSFRCCIVSGGLSILGLITVVALSSMHVPAASPIGLMALLALGLAVPSAALTVLSSLARAMLPSVLPSSDLPSRYVTFPELAQQLERNATVQAIRWLAPVAALMSMLVADVRP